MPPAPITLCGERGGDNEALDERRGWRGAALLRTGVCDVSACTSL